MDEQVQVTTVPLSETQLAVAELGEMLARGGGPEALEQLGWTSAPSLMRQRRQLLVEAEVNAADGLIGVLD